MLYYHKIFAIYLRIQGVKQEIIDLLQGRILRNVFVRHLLQTKFSSGKLEGYHVAEEHRRRVHTYIHF
jgi:hypothetical protein